MKIKFTHSETYSECEPREQQLLTLLAKVTWAGDMNWDGANGEEFRTANTEADAVLRSYGMFPTYNEDRDDS
jgi:hypothetical protein